MGKAVLNCQYKIDACWKEETDWLIEFIGQLAETSDCDVEIQHIGRNGCDLSTRFNIIPMQSGHPIDGNLLFAVEGAAAVVTTALRPICPKCGKNKGEPPSTTVRPGLCQECRSKLVPDDFKGNTVVGLIGKAGAGKDTVADHLVEKHGYQRIALADPIRDIVQAVLVLDHDSVWDRKLRELPLRYLPNLSSKSKDMDNKYDHLYRSTLIRGLHVDGKLKDEDYWTVRKLLQFIGTEMFRNLIWSEVWMNNLAQRLEPGANYVCTDVRFPNEMSGLKECFGGKTSFVEVVRKGCDGVVGILGHESESYTFEADVVLDNNGTLDDLYAHVDALVGSFDKAPTEEKVATTA